MVFDVTDRAAEMSGDLATTEATFDEAPDPQLGVREGRMTLAQVADDLELLVRKSVPLYAVAHDRRFSK